MTKKRKQPDKYRYRGLWQLCTDVLGDAGYVETDEGYPWVWIRTYDHGGTADSAGNRIRSGDITLPDEQGGDEGVWDAWVQRVQRGKGGKTGKADLYVRYVGIREVDGGDGGDGGDDG